MSTVLIVFSNSDINAAIYHLVKSLEAPWEDKAVATVLVQESIKSDFIQKLQQQLKPYEDQANVVENTKFTNALSVANSLNAQIIGIADADKVGPTLVYDFTHEQFGSNGQPTGVVTFHTFRTAKEAISLVSKETLKFTHASIWHENHSYAYELIAALKMSYFFINCHLVPMAMLADTMAQGKSLVTMDKKYHYETMPLDGCQKSIVFPIGSIFAN